MFSNIPQTEVITKQNLELVEQRKAWVNKKISPHNLFVSFVKCVDSR